MSRPVLPPPVPASGSPRARMSPIIDDTMSSDVVSMAASAGAGAAAEDDPTPAISTAVTEHGKDDHPFFHYYGLLPHQQNMLQDAVRTGTYQRAIVENPSNFAGKAVLDVGTGTGILAHFAVQAGARHVYAVEASNMADIAKKLIEANGLSDRITVIRGKVEEVRLPEKVDVIVSEPMGFMLIHERMLESYIAARDLFLKPGGLMMPSLGTIYFCPFTDSALYHEQSNKASFWASTDFYGLNLSSLQAECVADHFAQPIVGYFDRSILLSADVVTHVINFGTDTVADLAEINVPLHFTINKTEKTVKLSTGPETPGTHWYQCRLLLRAPIAVNATQSVSGHLKMTVNDKFSYNITMTMSLDGTTITASNRINLHDQFYHYLSNPASAVSTGTATESAV